MGDCDSYVYTTIYKIDNKDLLYSTGNSTQHSVMIYMGKDLKKSGYMLIPISQFIPPPLSPRGNYKFIFYICDSIFAVQITSSVPFF